MLESKTLSPPRPGSSDRALSPGGGRRGQSLHTPLPPSSGGHPGASPVQAGLEPGAEHRAQTRLRGGQAWDREAGPCYRHPPPSPAPPQAPDNPSPHPWLLRAPQRPPGPTGLLGSDPSREGPGHRSLPGWGPRPAHHWLRVQKGDSKWGGHQLGTSGGRTRTAPGPRGTRPGKSWGGQWGQIRALHREGERWSWREAGLQPSSSHGERAVSAPGAH